MLKSEWLSLASRLEGGANQSDSDSRKKSTPMRSSIRVKKMVMGGVCEEDVSCERSLVVSCERS